MKYTHGIYIVSLRVCAYICNIPKRQCAASIQQQKWPSLSHALAAAGRAPLCETSALHPNYNCDPKIFFVKLGTLHPQNRLHQLGASSACCTFSAVENLSPWKKQPRTPFLFFFPQPQTLRQVELLSPIQILSPRQLLSHRMHSQRQRPLWEMRWPDLGLRWKKRTIRNNKPYPVLHCITLRDKWWHDMTWHDMIISKDVLEPSCCESENWTLRYHWRSLNLPGQPSWPVWPFASDFRFHQMSIQKNQGVIRQDLEYQG